MSRQDRAARAARARHSPPSTRRACIGLCALITWSVVRAARAELPAPLDLPAALSLAHANSPTLEAARHRVDEVRGELTAASVLVPENPEVAVGAGPRFLDPGVTGNSVALEAGVSQRIEIGGQRGNRIGRARADLASAEAERDAASRAVDLAVATGFWHTLAAAERSRIASEHEALARELLDIATARFERGAATPIELNAARIRVAEATRQRARALSDAKAAAVRLAPLLGLDPATPPAVTGSLPAPTTSLPSVLGEPAPLLPEVAAAQARTQSAASAADLADAAAWPDLRLGARYANEEGSRTVIGQLAFGLPFQRNQGERQRARAALGRAEAEERAVRFRMASEFEEARIEAERARGALALYDADVLRALEENLSLLRTMLEAGKVAPAEVIVLQRELLEGRLGYLDARLDVAIADARVRTAAGLPILPTPNGGAR